MVAWVKSPTFQDFVVAADRVQPRDSLVVKRGRVVKKLPFEKGGVGVHKRTWAAFQQAVENEFSQEKIDFVSDRYGFDLDKMGNSKFPLERRYIEYFGVGAHSARIEDLKLERSRRSWFPSIRSLSSCGVQDIFHFYEAATEARYLGKTRDPSHISGAPGQAHENFAQDNIEMDRQRCNLFKGVASLLSKDPNIPREHPYFSRLAMGIVSLLETDRNCPDRGLIIPAPASRDGELDFYRVHDIISYGGMTAVALVPVSDQSSLEPILSFRCTKQTLGQAEAIPSVLNDAEEVMGESGYKAGAEALEKLVNDKAFTGGRKFKVLCYSLGGAHAGYFLCNHWKKVSEFIGFNFVGNSAKVVDTIAKEINALPDEALPPSFYLYRNVCKGKENLGDWVNKSGQKHIGCGISHPNSFVQLIEWVIDDKLAPTENVTDSEQIRRWMNIHGVRPMDARGEDEGLSPFAPQWKYEYRIYRGYEHLKQKLTDGGLEKKRQQIGEMVHWMVSFCYSLFEFLLRASGIKLFR